MLSQLLFRLARCRQVDRVVRFGFAHLSALLPVRRVCETDYVIAFHHPRPSWEHHILFVPKVPIPSLVEIRAEQVGVVRELVTLALGVAAREPFASAANRSGYALLANGGAYQDVGQLHFHLVSPAGESMYTCPESVPTDLLLKTDVLTAFHHPQPRRETHIVLVPRLDVGDDGIEAVLAAMPTLVGALHLAGGGYTLVIAAPPGQASSSLRIHLVSGGSA
jgi:histidine triad (HIT) family protein